MAHGLMKSRARSLCIDHLAKKQHALGRAPHTSGAFNHAQHGGGMIRRFSITPTRKAPGIIGLMGGGIRNGITDPVQSEAHVSLFRSGLQL